MGFEFYLWRYILKYGVENAPGCKKHDGGNNNRIIP